MKNLDEIYLQPKICQLELLFLEIKNYSLAYAHANIYLRPPIEISQPKNGLESSLLAIIFQSNCDKLGGGFQLMATRCPTEILSFLELSHALSCFLSLV